MAFSMQKSPIKITIIFFLIVFSLVAQKAKKPTLMVVPSDAWCFQNGYFKTFDNQGVSTKVSDYKRALQENTDLLLVISKLNGLMAERDFPLKNLETVLKGLENSRALDLVRTSRDTGASVAESLVDEIIKTAKADIIIQLTYTLNTKGPKKSITYNLQGLDSYSYKQVATAANTGEPSFSTELPLLLEEAVLRNMDEFTNSLQNHFQDLFQNGREVTLQVLTWDDWDGDLDELAYEIEDWLDEKTVEGRFSTTDVTSTYAKFDQIRMPLFNERGRAMAARNFFRDLSKKLSGPAYNIPNKIATEGLGKVSLILGGK